MFGRRHSSISNSRRDVQSQLTALSSSETLIYSSSKPAYNIKHLTQSLLGRRSSSSSNNKVAAAMDSIAETDHSPRIVLSSSIQMCNKCMQVMSLTTLLNRQSSRSSKSSRLRIFKVGVQLTNNTSSTITCLVSY